MVPQEIRDEYISKLEKLNSYRRAKLIEQARLDGITIRDNNKDIAESNRQVVNSIIQGSAADMSKRAMILIGQNQELKDLGFKMLFPVHDIYIIFVVVKPTEHMQKWCSIYIELTVN